VECETLKPDFLPRRLMAAIALVSFASLLLELSLTRLFSVVLFYHFAFLAISVALLGLGAGGVLAYVARARMAQWSTRGIGTWVCVANALLITAVLEVVLRIPVTLELSRKNFWKLTEIYVAAAVPFFLTGLLFAVVFARENRRIGLLYSADLMGGALACMAVVPLLNVVGGPNAVLFAAAAMAAAGALWAGIGEDESQRSWGVVRGRSVGRGLSVVVAALLLIAIAANHSGKWVDIVYAKGMRRDQPWMLFAKWNAISRVEVNQVGESRYIVIDADASSAIMNVDPARWGEETRPTPKDNGLPANPTYNWRRDLMAAAPAVANVLRPRGEFAIIGPGGGVDVLRAVANGSRNVTGIEINSIIADTIMRGRYADYAYHLYELPQVHMYVNDGRSFLRASRDRYDVVQMTLVDTWASTAAGAFALSENNLYTVQAFREYFDHLKPDGMIAITRWEFKEPREALRVVSQAIEALHQGGVADPKRNFMVVSDGPLDEDGRPVTVLAKKSEFTAEEELAISQHLAGNPNLRPLYMPSVQPPNAFTQLIASNDPRVFARDYAYDISPATDDAPFFFFTLKTKNVIRDLVNHSGHGMDWRINLGIVVLGLLLVISIAAVLLFMVLPLAVQSIRGRMGRHRQVARVHTSRVAALLYFVAIGLGYILVEVTFIQRFVLFLGHPTYALTVVVFLMLLSSGAGSMAARQWMGETGRIRLVLAAIVMAVVAYIFVLPGLLASLVGLAFGIKLAISAVLLAPLGFAMGMPFPTGLRALGGKVEEPVLLGGGDAAVLAVAPQDTLIEWAWAMNAAASVLGSVLAIVIAIHLGLNATLATGAVAYGAAGALTRNLV
jgi:hypothetical protein